MPADTRRDARSSREPSAPNNTSRGLDTEKMKAKSMNGTLDGWVEPSLATKPSFEDHGGAPYGVLEHMQPLGEPPSTRVRARVKGDGARKSMLGRGGAAAGLDAQETPEGTPGPQFSSQGALDALLPLPPIAMDDEDDDDYAPGKKSKKKERAAKPRASKRQSESAGPPAEAAPPKNKGGRPKKIVDKPVEQKPAQPADDVINVNRVYTPEKLKEVVEEAKKRALETNKLVLYGAVEEIYQQSLTSRRLTELLEAILCVTATKEQTAEFQTYVKTAKKKLRRAKNEAAARKSPVATDAQTNHDRSLPVRSPAKIEDTAHVKDESPALPSTEKAEPPKPKFSIKVKSPQKSSTKSGTKKHGSATSSPAVKNKTEEMDDDGNVSELSELTELSEGEEMAVDTPEELDEMSVGPSGRVNGTKVRDQAAERGSLGVQGSNLKRSSADAEIHETEDDRALSAKKLKLSNKVMREYDYQDSHVRSSLNGLSRPSRGPGAKNTAGAPPKITLQPNGGSTTNSRGSRAISVDADSPLSSPAGSSRRSTPHVWKGPPKQTGKRAKTKTSPEKKHQHSYGGMPGAGGAGRDSPIGDDDNEELSENNDFCSSCGGSGYLLCCDGCDRAFHFTCLDPPIKEEASELNEPWFCFICVAKRPISVEQPEKAARGLFAPLLNTLNKTNPRTFQLSEYIRNYFEGVGTAANGEFTEAVKTRTRKTEEKIDDLKTKDSKGNIVICYACSKSSLGKRSIITCDYCNQHWHLDCLDPPLANIPNRDPLGNKKSDWMCPLHVDHELRQVDTRLLKPAFSSRRVHIRKPRQAKTAETALQRGLQNNGIIEIADDDSDDTDSEFYEEDREPTVYKMPAHGIKLDFIDKIKQTRIQEHREARLHKRVKLDHATNTPGALSQANFARRPFRDQHTALSLVQFANANPDLNLGGDRLENLLGTVISEAPEKVIDDIAAGEGHKTSSHTNGFKASPSPINFQTSEALSPEHRRELEILQELIKRKLEGSKP